MLAVSGPASLLDRPDRLHSAVASNLEQLLSRPLEFVEGSSSGILAVPEGRYRPVNVLTRSIPEPLAKASLQAFPLECQPNELKIITNSASLHMSPILLHYPPAINSVGAGFLNTGNTCFINSVLQGLLHAPPLLHLLREHQRSTCAASTQFCAICKLRELMMQKYASKRFISPDSIVLHLGKIAKHFRRGRQEDAHEFLRYLIEALQRASLAGLDGKADPKLAETSWIHRLFGGRLRSRVKCRECGHPSDTFDSILDLSVDVNGVHTLKESLHKFIKLDVLKGADRYHCEKCRQSVIADKGFTIHDAPTILTIHMKRFTPFGRKIVNPIRYEDRLDLQPYMSEGQFGPTYRLFAVINHAGKGPNSGHYYTYVKSNKDRWFEMNDESVEPRHGALAERNAYILLYVREAGEALRQVTMKSLACTKPFSPKSHLDDGDDAGIPAFVPKGPMTSEARGQGLPTSDSGKEITAEDHPRSPLEDSGPTSNDKLSICEEGGNSPRHGTIPLTTLRSPQSVACVQTSPRNLGGLDSPSLKRKIGLSVSRPFGNEGPSAAKRTREDIPRSFLRRGQAGNPFGGRTQYRDNLTAAGPNRENRTSNGAWPRKAGMQKRMKKRSLF